MGMTICRDVVSRRLYFYPARATTRDPPTDGFPNNYELCITHYELTNGSPLRMEFPAIMNYELTKGSPLRMEFPNNYASCIMNYELSQWMYFPTIMHYEL